MRYSDDLIEEIKTRNSLLELVSERTEVKQSGRSNMACCPFHSEKTPSFNINEEDGLYYCFGCGKKGNTFTFVMETRGLTFPEAVRFLAQRANISLPVQSKAQSEYEKGLSKRKNLLRKILFDCQNLYEDIFWGRNKMIPDTDSPREFLRGRNFNDQTLKSFRVGYSPPNGSRLFDQIYPGIKSNLDVSEKEFEAALVNLGLLKKYSGGNKGELFRDRVLFPITRSDGNPIAFGGRILESSDNLPKYINSPESPIYEKRRSLFGLSQGFIPAQKAREVYIVEGYTDVMAFNQIGIENTLAVCGTALTEDHAKILSRFVNRVNLIFDGDKAGVIAASRSFPAFINSGIEVIPVFLPEGEDPDSIAREIYTSKKEIDYLEKFLKEQTTSHLKIYLESKASELRGRERGELTNLETLNPNEKGKLALDLSSILSKIKNPVEKELRVKESCDLLGASEKAIKELINESLSANKDFISANKRHQTHLRSVNTSKNSTNNVISPVSPENISRNMKLLSRQITVAALSDPHVLTNSAIFKEAQEASSQDERYILLFNILRKKCEKNDDNTRQHLKRGLSYLLQADPHETSELLAEYQGIIMQCDLEQEKLIEEAIDQITKGGSTFEDFIHNLSNTASRIRLSDELEVLRIKEGKELDAESKLKLAQEKLMRKRSLEQLNSKV